MTDNSKTPRKRLVRRASRGREDILTSASEVIAQRGYGSARFSDVADRAGTSISTLQYLFGNREDLIAQAVAARTNEYLANAREQTESIADPMERLRWMTVHLAACDVPDDDAARENWLVWVEFWHAALRDPELHEASVIAYNGWRQLFAEAVQYAIDAGVITPVDDIDLISQGACALADGLGIQVAVGPPGLTWQIVSQIMRQWLAAVLDCPQLAD
jgi:AcrR family transcriptional regulator